MIDPNQPVPFWDSPAFTSAMVLLIGTLIGGIQFWMKSRSDANAQKQAAHTTAVGEKVNALSNDTAVLSGTVATIEKHTNGMLTALQTKVDSQEKEKISTAALTEKDKEIALLKKEPER